MGVSTHSLVGPSSEQHWSSQDPAIPRQGNQGTHLPVAFQLSTPPLPDDCHLGRSLLSLHLHGSQPPGRKSQ